MICGRRGYTSGQQIVRLDLDGELLVIVPDLVLKVDHVELTAALGHDQL